MTGVTIPIVEGEWLTFTGKVLDRMLKALGEKEPPPVLVEMLHNAFYAGALTLFTLERQSDDAAWQTLASQIEAYYRAAIEQASRARPAV